MRSKFPIICQLRIEIFWYSGKPTFFKDSQDCRIFQNVLDVISIGASEEDVVIQEIRFNKSRIKARQDLVILDKFLHETFGNIEVNSGSRKQSIDFLVLFCPK